MLRFVRQIKKDDDSQSRCRQSFQQKKPLPAGKPAQALHFKERSGDRSADNAGQRRCRHKQSDIARQIPAGETSR